MPSVTYPDHLKIVRVSSAILKPFAIRISVKFAPKIIFLGFKYCHPEGNSKKQKRLNDISQILILLFYRYVIHSIIKSEDAGKTYNIWESHPN
ncbi:MAG: hypothetical protein JRF53_16975 [Deltaproteobacteria bacterium]|nr:hypothetical protein [Deltaproteobacteria bacterium]